MQTKMNTFINQLRLITQFPVIDLENTAYMYKDNTTHDVFILFLMS